MSATASEAQERTSIPDDMPRDAVTCQICGAVTHVVVSHLKKAHPEMSLAEYREDFPEAPILSQVAQWKLESRGRPEKKADLQIVVNNDGLEAVHKLLGLSAPIKREDGRDMMFRVPEDGSWPECEWARIPDVDTNYVWQTAPTRKAMGALNKAIPAYTFGHAGTGKTTLWEQVCARLNWPMVRKQHDRFTEPYQIVGSKEANENGTYFAPGPLALAMRNGWVYVSDEHDWAPPACQGVYQSVLEGKPLVISDATVESGWRTVEAHPNFRFVATGNTNGAGDESGLFGGTSQQNFAGMSRFVMIPVGYMPEDAECSILMSKLGIEEHEAKKVVGFASRIRTAFEEGKISAPIGPRELLLGVKLGLELGSVKDGIEASFVHKLPEQCAVTASEVMQRILG